MRFLFLRKRKVTDARDSCVFFLIDILFIVVLVLLFLVYIFPSNNEFQVSARRTQYLGKIVNFKCIFKMLNKLCQLYTSTSRNIVNLRTP